MPTNRLRHVILSEAKDLGISIFCLLSLFLGACGGGSSAPPGAPADFSFSVSPGAISVGQGATNSPVAVSVSGQNGFTGSVSVTLSGLPAGTSTSPASPFSVAAGANQPVSFLANAVASPGSAMVTFQATSGGLSHNASLALTVTATTPVVRTYQAGTRLYLESVVGNESSQVGLESQWGGTIVEASWNGTNFVNQYDTGREVQAALYDGNAQYDSCAGCTGVFGWDPVQGGDRYVHGSPVLAQTLAANSIYIKTQPYQWYPNDKGGSPSQPVLGDTYFEQTLTTVSNHPRAFQLHYKITHFGADHHANALQEFPAVYVNLGFDRFVYYGGAAPWTNGAVTVTTLPSPPQAAPTLYMPEKWGALVNSQDLGLTIYVPAQYPYGAGASFAGTSGPTGFGTNYYRPHTSFTWTPQGVLEGDIYLVVGDYQDARAAVYDLKNTLPPSDLFTPFGYVDTPAPGSQLAGSINVAGWAFDDVAVSKVEIYVDGVLAGTATYGLPRPDVATVWPNAPTNCGYQFPLLTTAYANGPHTIKVEVTDSSGNVAEFPDVAIGIQN